MKYSEPRYTKNIDVWIATDAENAHLIYIALKEFGALWQIWSRLTSLKLAENFIDKREKLSDRQ